MRTVVEVLTPAVTCSVVLPLKRLNPSALRVTVAGPILTFLARRMSKSHTLS